MRRCRRPARDLRRGRWSVRTRGAPRRRRRRGDARVRRRRLRACLRRCRGGCGVAVLLYRGRLVVGAARSLSCPWVRIRLREASDLRRPSHLSPPRHRPLPSDPPHSRFVRHERVESQLVGSSGRVVVGRSEASLAGVAAVGKGRTAPFDVDLSSRSRNGAIILAAVSCAPGSGPGSSPGPGPGSLIPPRPHHAPRPRPCPLHRTAATGSAGNDRS